MKNKSELFEIFFYTCVLSNDASIFWPRPVFERCINAAIIAPWQYKPVEISVNATPAFAGAPSF